MLDSVIKFLAGQLNAYLTRRTGSEVVRVVPGALADDSGKWAIEEGAIGLTLVNVEEERILRCQLPERIHQDGSEVVLQPELRLNLHVVCAARIKNYENALRYLSYVLTYFQAHPVFMTDDFPALDPDIKRLSVDLISYGPEQLNQMWAYIGAKYLPSAIYRVRLVSLQDAEPREIATSITTITTSTALLP